MGIQSWDEFGPEQKDYFGNRHNRAKKSENSVDLFTVLRNLEEAMKELERTRFAQILSILMEKEIFE